MAFQRLWEVKSTFKKCSAKLSPDQRKEFEDVYTDQGSFEFREQKAQVRFSALQLMPLSLIRIITRFHPRVLSP